MTSSLPAIPVRQLACSSGVITLHRPQACASRPSRPVLNVTTMAVSPERRAQNEADPRWARRKARLIGRQTALLQVREAVREVVEAGAPEWLRGEQVAAYQAEAERLLSRI